jgi:U3 small nucleolar ribonucleoprotein protein IMP4
LLGTPIPNELKDVAVKLADAMRYDDVESFKEPNEIDDEYSTAGITDPKIMITSSHSPSSKLEAFVKELKLIFPGIYFNFQINKLNSLLISVVGFKGR